MISTIIMALMAMLTAPCIANSYVPLDPIHKPKPVPVRPGHAIPPMLPTVSPPVHTSQSAPPPPSHTHVPEVPRPFPRHPIPRPRLPVTPPSVSGVPPPPTLNPTNPTPVPPTAGYSSVPIYAVSPAQPPVVPRHQFLPRHQFPPNRQFPPRHGGAPSPPVN